MRFGIIGTGQISRWFIAACGEVTGAEPVAICSRSRDTGDYFAKEHGLAAVFTDPAEMCADGRIDAVYVASPVGAHAAQVHTALAHGLPVLCEKTLGVDLAETASLLDDARARRLVLLEAVRPVHDPVLGLIADHLPDLGRIWHARFEKCQYSSRYDAFRQGIVRNAFDPALGNSALADIGVYCVQPAVRLFGDPREVSAMTTRLPNGFEASGAILLGYEGMTVHCRYSKVTSGVTPSVIEGEDATMTIDSIGEPGVVEVHHRDGEVITLVGGPAREPWEDLHYEIEQFCALVAAGEYDHEFAHVSRVSMEIMERTR